MVLGYKDLEWPYDMQIDFISKNYIVDFEGKDFSSPFKVHIYLMSRRKKKCRKKYYYKQTLLVWVWRKILEKKQTIKEMA